MPSVPLVYYDPETGVRKVIGRAVVNEETGYIEGTITDLTVTHLFSNDVSSFSLIPD